MCACGVLCVFWRVCMAVCVLCLVCACVFVLCLCVLCSHRFTCDLCSACFKYDLIHVPKSEDMVYCLFPHSTHSTHSTHSHSTHSTQSTQYTQYHFRPISARFSLRSRTVCRPGVSIVLHTVWCLRSSSTLSTLCRGVYTALSHC
jgi:hypothetical protein